MNINELIEKLEKMDKEKDVFFDFGAFCPDEFMSWRGDYSQPSLSFCKSPTKTVGQLLEMAKKFSGSTQDGYKGGEFYMNPRDDIWISEYGRSSETSLIDVTEEDWRVILHTKYEKYELI